MTVKVFGTLTDPASCQEPTNDQLTLEAWTLTFERNYVVAERHFRDLIKRYKEQEGADHTKVANALAGLSSAYLVMGCLGKAESTAEEALNIWTKIEGMICSECGTLIEQLAAIQKADGRFGVAARSLRRAIDVWEALCMLGRQPSFITWQYLSQKRHELAELRRLEKQQVVIDREMQSFEVI